MLCNNILVVSAAALLMSGPCCAAADTSDTVRNSMRRIETQSQMHDLMDTDHGKFYGDASSGGQRDDYTNVAPLSEDEKNKPKEWHPQMHQHYQGTPGTADTTNKE
jgi:hypothetical protein